MNNNKSSSNADSPLVSVIIPVYNVEKYLEECLDSVINQTLKNIEIICINDGSTDGSFEILKKYGKKDNRVAVIDQEKMGLSVARNNGFERAIGTYIYYLDSDDTITLDALENLSAQMKNDDLDMICSIANPFYDENDVELMDEFVNKQKYYEKRNSYHGISSGINLFQRMVVNKELVVQVSTFMFKTDFIIENELDFYPDIIHEDELYIFKCFLYAKRVSYTNKMYFNRRVRSGSVMTSSKEIARLEGTTIVVKEILLSILNEKLEADVIEAIWNNCKRLLKIIGGFAEVFSAEEIYDELNDEALSSIIVRIALERRAMQKRIKLNNKKIYGIKKKLENESLKRQNAQKRYKKIKNSNSYKIGLMITWPIRKIKKVLRITKK